MTTRYTTEVGQNGLKRWVRASPPAAPKARVEDGPPGAAEALVVSVEDDLRAAHALLRTASANVRELARLARARRRSGRPVGDYDGRRELARELGVDPAGIAKARALAGRTQRELGRELGYSRGLVAECEKGRRNPPPKLTEWAAGVLRTSTKGG